MGKRDHQLQHRTPPSSAPWGNSYRTIDDGAGGERFPFLQGSSSTAIPTSSSSTSGPVRLTPGWEDTSPPPFDDILRTSALNLGQAPPKDRFNLVYLIFVIHGIGTLMPWNMFITAQAYFNYRLDAKDALWYKSNFFPVLGFAAQVPNVFFNWLNIFVQLGGNLKTRIVWSIIFEVILFIATVGLAMDTSVSPGVFFWLTMVSVVLINMAGGIYQNSIYGIASKLNYAGAVVLGSNISGTFTAVISILSVWLAPSERTSAIYYFITALFVLLICFDSYFALPLNRFYRYHEAQSLKEQENRRQVGSQIGKIPRTPYLAVLKKCWPQCLNVFLVFFVTLAIFPGIHGDIKMVDREFFTTEKYFAPVTCFLTFNTCAMIGNLFPTWIQWPGPKYLWIPVTLRFLFIPFFLLCNYQPTLEDGEAVVFPYLINNDWAYWGGAVLMGLTSGYYSSLAMIYGPKTVENRFAPIAGMFGAAFLITGIFVGVISIKLTHLFVTNVSFGYPRPPFNSTENVGLF